MLLTAYESNVGFARMIEKLVEVIAGATEEQFREISLEDAALCRTWCEAQERHNRKKEVCETAQAQLDAWLAEHAQQPPDSEGHRYQWVLRDLIDVVQRGELFGLERDELDFLCCVYVLADRFVDRTVYARVRSVLAPYLNEIEVRRKELPDYLRLTGLAKRVHFVDAKELEDAPHVAARSIAGIGISARGPLRRYSGHVKLLGNVPDDCTLVVENGCCSVAGYVMGRLAVTHHCDVRHNISGVVISSMGSIRARNIIDQAYVVAKAGSVHVCRVENPRLLFAGERLVVVDTIRRGNIIAPDIDVHEEAIGGRIQVSRCLSGGRFRATPGLPLEIIFRKQLSASDFGGIRSKEAARLSSEVLRLKMRVLTLESLINSLDREIERLAENALYYILSDETAREQADAIRRDKGRRDVIDRIIEGLLGMAYAIAERAAERANAPAQPDRGDHDEAEVMFGVADAVLNDLSSAGSAERDVPAFIGRVADIRDGFRSGAPGNRLAASSLARIRQELQSWIAERNRIGGQLEQREAHLRSQLEFGQFVYSASDRDSAERMLKTLLASAQERPQKPAVAKKLASNFVATMCRNIEKRRKAAEERRHELLEMRREFEEKANRLRAQHHIVITLGKGDTGEGPRVSGRFEGGVVICADMLALEQSEASANARLVVPDTGEASMTYQRRFTSIVEAGP
ncbi:MAG TPA: hypothetical protein PLM14_13555 [Candidatus Hydrogenedentes bacterium]|nr:hypothetical protein [Candidatus Hydrogenedentota bacterium]